MTEKEKDLYTGLLHAELADVHKRMDKALHGSLHESYLLGVADGLVIAASHLGLTLRPDLVEKE